MSNCALVEMGVTKIARDLKGRDVNALEVRPDLVEEIGDLCVQLCDGLCSIAVEKVAFDGSQTSFDAVVLRRDENLPVVEEP